MDCPNIDEYCNSCGEEADLLTGICCDDGEIVPNDDEQCDDY